MEEALDAYEQPYDDQTPLVCFDEKPVQLLDELVPLLPPALDSRPSKITNISAKGPLPY